MTATLPEEDLDIAAKKAEKCQGLTSATYQVRGDQIVSWESSGIRCPNQATHELLFHCDGCDRSVRRAYCNEHRTEMTAATRHLGGPCKECHRMTMFLVGVMPL